MKKFLLGTVGAVALLTGGAQAADLPVKARPMAPVVAPISTWTGCYIGAHVGGAWSRLRITDVGTGGSAFASAGTAGQEFNVDDSGIFGGGQIGCNYQADLFVFGIEGDLGGMDLKGDALDPLTASNTRVGIGSGLYGDITGRLGIAAGPALFYAKGGWGFYNGRETFSTTSAAFISHSDVGTFSGGVFGGGIEYKLWSNWSAKIEYLHFAFNSQTFNVLATGGTFPFREKLSVDTLKVGLNYQFNWGGPVVARY